MVEEARLKPTPVVCQPASVKALKTGRPSRPVAPVMRALGMMVVTRERQRIEGRVGEVGLVCFSKYHQFAGEVLYMEDRRLRQ
jgi:hypothetical protein